MSSTIFVVVAIVFLARFDTDYNSSEGAGPLITILFAFILALIWDAIVLRCK